MRADIAERTGPGSDLVEPPAHRHVGVAVVVEQELRPRGADRADRTFVDQLAGHRDRRPLAVDEADLSDAVAGRRASTQQVATVGVERQRLLAQHVLAAPQRVERDVDVVVVRCADVDDVDVVGAVTSCQRGHGRDPNPSPDARSASAGSKSVTATVSTDGISAAEQHPGIAVGDAVDLAHETRADQADSYRRHHILLVVDGGV